jgi:hypothetical protein
MNGFLGFSLMSNKIIWEGCLSKCVNCIGKGSKRWGWMRKFKKLIRWEMCMYLEEKVELKSEILIVSVKYWERGNWLKNKIGLNDK